MNKLFCLITVLAATSIHAFAQDSAPVSNDKVVLNCSITEDENTRELQVTQDATGAYHYTASNCTFVSHGCATIGGNMCETSSGEIRKSDEDSANFALQGTTIHRICGQQMAFDDATKGVQFLIPLSKCTFGK